MSVLIKGMEMPQRCMGCTLCYVGHMGDLMCEALRRPIKVDETGRDRFCPLIEVPPHGRLADLDKMINDFWDCDSMIIGNYELDKIKTIIEAEEYGK